MSTLEQAIQAAYDAERSYEDFVRRHPEADRFDVFFRKRDAQKALDRAFDECGRAA